MIYKSFAKVYDGLMTDTPYDLWLSHLLEKYNKYQLLGKDVLDLACGTGEISNRLAKKGYKVLGVDISPEMLEIAHDKANNSNLKIRYVNQDITELELHQNYDSIISFCDGFNYIKDKDELKEVFKRINKYLNTDGLFIFDISSEYKLEHILGQNVFTETDEEVTYIWENYYDSKSKILEFDLTIFTKVNDLYKREEEAHIQRAYSINEMKELMTSTGFEVLEILDTNTNKNVTDDSERIMFVGKKVKND